MGASSGFALHGRLQAVFSLALFMWLRRGKNRRIHSRIWVKSRCCFYWMWQSVTLHRSAGPYVDRSDPLDCKKDLVSSSKTATESHGQFHRPRAPGIMKQKWLVTPVKYSQSTIVTIVWSINNYTIWLWLWIIVQLHYNTYHQSYYTTD